MKRIIPHIVIVSFLLLMISVSSSYSQEDSRVKSVPRIEWNVYAGQLIIHREAMEGMKVTKPYFGQELRLGFQTTGKKYWEELFNYPIYGFGIYSGYFNNEIIGNPLAVFGFMEIPFVRKENHYWSTNWGSGMGFNVNEYDPEKNPDNVAVGTDINIYVDFSTLYKYKITPRFELGTGIKFQHLSNGALRHPNLGLNMLSGQVSVAYLPGNGPIKYHKPEPEQRNKKYEFTTMYAGGFSSVSRENTTKYYNSVVSLSANRIMSFKRTLGVGVDIFYNEFLKENEDVGMDASTNNLMSYAGFVSTDLVANKFRMVVQLGVYVWRPVDYDILFYERVALRYYFIPNLFASVSIKAHGFKAQYLEWGLGVSF